MFIPEQHARAIAAKIWGYSTSVVLNKEASRDGERFPSVAHPKLIDENCGETNDCGSALGHFGRFFICLAEANAGQCLNAQPRTF